MFDGNGSSLNPKAFVMTIEANSPAQPNPVEANMSSSPINNASLEQSSPDAQPVHQRKRMSKRSSYPFFFLAIVFYVTGISLFIVWRLSSEQVTKTSEYGHEYVVYEHDHELWFAAVICTLIASMWKLAAWILFCSGWVRERREVRTNGYVADVPLHQQQQSWTSPDPAQQVQVQAGGVSTRA